MVILSLLKLKEGMKISSDSVEPRKLSQEGQPVFGSSRKGRAKLAQACGGVSGKCPL